MPRQEERTEKYCELLPRDQALPSFRCGAARLWFNCRKSEMDQRIITLLTDFGSRDAFVGIMKGVMLGINPAVSFIDLSHEVPPQDILAGALMLQSAIAFFPPKTIHVAVVDPSVGSSRRPLLVETVDAIFI